MGCLRAESRGWRPTVGDPRTAEMFLIPIDRFMPFLAQALDLFLPGAYDTSHRITTKHAHSSSREKGVCALSAITISNGDHVLFCLDLKNAFYGCPN